MSVTIDSTRLKAKLDAAARAAYPAQRKFLHGMAATVATKLSEVAPKDTNRYIASILQGFKQAGVDAAPSPPALKMSEYRMIQRHQLERQIQVIWKKLLSTRGGIQSLTRALDKCGYTRGRPLDAEGLAWTKRLRSLKALEPAYVKLHAASLVQLERFNSNRFAIVFGVGRGAIHKAIAGDAQNQASRVLPIIEEVERANGGIRLKGVKLVVTVRQGVNGGEGHTAVAGGDPVIVVRSKEPHARILESKRGIVRKVLGDVRPAGLKQLKRAMVVEIAQKSGLQAGAA